LVLTLSVGLVGLKGGIWAIATGGTEHVRGPDNSFMSDNNDVALAFNMTLPLLYYLGKGEPRQWLRWLLRGCFVMTIIATIFTYSRGGFVALVLVGCMLMIKARYKSLAVVTLVCGSLAATVIIPDKWTNRMETIQTYEQDRSAQGRLNAWAMAWNLALDRPLTGGGFETWVPSMFARYAPDPNNVRDVHSTYFEMLGEQGFIGLALYLMLLAYVLVTLSRLKWAIRRNSNLQWAYYYPDMLQVAILAYMVGGAFLGRAYFDLFYHLVAATIILKNLIMETTKVPQEVKVFASRARYLHPASQHLTRLRG
jgi:probable O-glycosylation ligase (exosortase A-associated)